MHPMLDALQSLYGEAANDIIAVLPAEWTNVYVHVELDDLTQAVTCYYRGLATPEPTYASMPDSVYDAFRKMRAIAVANDAKGGWTTASFVLDRSGKFKIDYGYDPIPIEGERARRRAWRESLGIT